jgi:hypothetical protein
VQECERSIKEFKDVGGKMYAKRRKREMKRDEGTAQMEAPPLTAEIQSRSGSEKICDIRSLLFD